MNWTALLRSEVEEAYRAADALVAMVDDAKLDWKPETGSNWMTTAQLLEHITTACGGTCRGFVTGDWGLPDGSNLEEMAPEEMLPAAAALPAAASVAAAREALAADKELALQMVEQAADRMDEEIAAPWEPGAKPLGQQLLNMVSHLNNHKAQLFYYLKLQGEPVNTMHYYGLA